MSDTFEKLHRELQAAQRALAEAQARCERHDAEHSAAAKELEDNRSALLFMLEDLETARKKIEQSHKEWMDALDVLEDPIFMHDREYRILRCNKAYQQCAGMSFHDLTGRRYYEIFPKADAPQSCCRRAMEEDTAEEEEVTVGDAIYRVRAFPINDEHGAYLYSLHILEDITESRRNEKLLQHSEHDLKEAQRVARLGSWNFDIAGNVLTWSAEIYRIFEIDPQEFGASYEAFLNAIHPDDRARVDKVYGEAVKSRTPYDIEHRLLMKDGRVKYVHEVGETYYGGDGKPFRSFGIVHDITERKQAEITIEHTNRALSTLSEVNRSLVRADSEDELLQSICRSIVEQRGYRMAWVGYKQHDENSSIRVMSHAGYEQGYLDAIQLTWAETGSGMVPSGRAIRSGVTQLCQNIATDPAYLLWHDKAVERGFMSSIALPLANSEVFGVLTVYANETNAFTPGEIALLEEMAGDLAYGVRTLHIRHERDLALEQSRQHFVKLQSNLEDTVRAIASIVEMRDPYTAGHQLRVADLAAAIARKMGLSDDQVHGIHLAGVVHDLGKIRIPAEILSKPGRLTDIEFDLIKIHPQAGYDILKGIDFPWPVAQMVLQHHERLDGSGYPQGLKGDAILFEARILSVADVVEAISAHRPYRAGLGVEAALEEISKNRAVLYDPQVVDACVSIFREQGYVFPG